jgi:protein-S-isoprenylcysteine O-methyltransferase Ste14
MQSILRIYLPLYLLLYIAVAFALPTYRTWKSTGINPITFGQKDNAHNYIGKVMKVLIALLFATALLFAFGFEQWLSPILFLRKEAVQLAGLILIHFSLIWISIAQYQMSTSWRIGIDEVNKTELITNGLFRLSRNPIFLGMIISLLGLFLIIPNSMTLLCFVTTYFIIHIQIRLEEEFLSIQHGDVYQNYLLNTPRLA